MLSRGVYAIEGQEEQHRTPDTSSIRSANLLMEVCELLRILQEDGWYLVHTRDSHRQFKHPVKPGRVTVPGKISSDIAPGTLRSVLMQQV